ncbi:unnamed protein product [Owenia fusiformis]|uniref:Alpha-mannosidase n=1 Tax=Owenia fusiformis TaxID=6347 RepID=A0A8J1U5L3_OWEFU|nr:unnamed protein product [Owenia fusiformis]
MKFWQRVLVAVLIVGIVITYLLYGDGDAWTTKSKIKQSRLVDSHVWPIPVQKAKVIDDLSECDFAQRTPAEADIDTIDLFNKAFNMSEQTRERVNEVKNDTDDIINVIIMPHSHTDPGWLKTVEEYYRDQVMLIFDNAVSKLTKYPDMSFIWTETVFLERWWREQPDDKKAKFKELVKRGQLELTLGGWVMPDEATTHYYSIIDEMITGHQWLIDNIGVKPKNSWAIDPFGHSGSIPYLLKKAGMENMIALRIHREVKYQMAENRNLEFRWRQRWDQKGTNDMMCQIMPYKLYSIKHSCGPGPFVCLRFDFRKIPGEYSESRSVPIDKANIEKSANMIVDQYRKKNSLMRHNVVLVPLGDDFRYDRFVEWDQQYFNYKKLMKHINANKKYKMQIQFGTLETYFNAVRKSAFYKNEASFPTLSGDFYPYTDQNDEFWTGYFTTRPFHKMLSRQLASLIRSAEILNVLAVAYASKTNTPFPALEYNMESLQAAHRGLGLFQHHDAITGTEKNYVAHEYEDVLMFGIKDAEKTLIRTGKFLFADTVKTEDDKNAKDKKNPFILTLDKLGMFKTPIDDKDSHVLDVSVSGTPIVIFNPLALQRNDCVRVVVKTNNLEVKDSEGHIVVSQINPLWKDVHTIKYDEFELVFFIDIPPLASKTYFISNRRGSENQYNFPAEVKFFNNKKNMNYKDIRHFKAGRGDPSPHMIFVENPQYKVMFSTQNGLLQSIHNKNNKNTTKVAMDFAAYESRGSGAYIFFPTGHAKSSKFETQPMFRVISGPIVTEVQVVYKRVLHCVRLYNTTTVTGAGLEIYNIVNMAESRDEELIMRFNTGIHNDLTMYTDSNGFQMMRRNTRLGHFSFIQENYYPMTSAVYIQDPHHRLSVLGTCALGVATLSNGELEIMLDRRLTYDDNRGMGEGVLDTRPTPSHFFLMLENFEDSSLSSKQYKDKMSFPSLTSQILSQHIENPAVTFFVKSKSVPTKKLIAPLKDQFPCDINLISIRGMPDPNNVKVETTGFIIQRFGYQCNMPLNTLQCTTSGGDFELGNIFKDFTMSDLKEWSLSYMHQKADISTSQAVELSPMEIYTYSAKLQ